MSNQNICKLNFFFQVHKRCNDSRAWKGILDTRNILNIGIHWIVENGENIDFWTAKWINGKSITGLNESIQPINEWKVLDFIVENKWDINKLYLVIPKNIIDQIITIPIPITKQEDIVCWENTSNENFLVKSATCMQMGEKKRSQNTIYNGIWNLNIMPKVKFFVWTLVLRKLPVRNNIKWYIHQNNRNCALCQSNLVTEDHH